MHSPYMTLCPVPRDCGAPSGSGGYDASRRGAAASFQYPLKAAPRFPAGPMRVVLGLVAALLLSASLAGCFERRGTLAVDVLVSDGGALGQFARINLTLHRVTLDARSLNPEQVPSLVERLELVGAARSGEVSRVFQGEVRADRFEKITITTPPGATYQGQLRDGTNVALVVPGGAFIATSTFDVPRGGSVTYIFAIGVTRTNTGVGADTYRIEPVPEESGPR